MSEQDWTPGDIPVDDGSGHMEGTMSQDEHLVVRGGEWHETELGKVERWRNQAPDLYEAFMASTEVSADLYSELKNLLRLLEPVENTLNVPGLATLNGARAAIRKAERTQQP